MKIIWTLFPAALGFIGVMQAGLNRRIGQALGLSYATLINASVLFTTALIVLILLQAMPHAQVPPELHPIHRFRESFRFWYLIPGICGYLMVTGVPLSIGKIGAVSVFIALVGGQMVGSAVWDLFVEGHSLPWNKIAAAGLAIAAIALSSWNR